MAGLIYKELWHDKKTREWSADEFRLWVLCISFTEDHLKDGLVIAEDDVAAITALNGIPAATVAALVGHRGLDQVEGGYEVHNYRTRGKLSRQRAQAGSRGGLATALANDVANTPGNLRGVGSGVVQEIFDVWRELTGKTRARLDEKRRRVLIRALVAYSPEDVRDAVRGWQNDPWEGRPQQNEITILLRDAEHIEKFRDLWRNPPARHPQSQAAKNAMTLLQASRSVS